MSIHFYGQNAITRPATGFHYLLLPTNAVNASLANTPSFIFHNSGNRYLNPALHVSTFENKVYQIDAHFTPLAWAWNSTQGKSYMLDLNYSASFSAKHAVTVGLNYLNYGSFELIDETFTSLGNNVAYEIKASAGYAFQINPYFSLGMGTSFINSTHTSLNQPSAVLENVNSVNQFLFDFGLNYRAYFKKQVIANYGIAILDMGAKNSYDGIHYFFVPTRINMYANVQQKINNEHIISYTFQTTKSLIPVNIPTQNETQVIGDNTFVQAPPATKDVLTTWGESFEDYSSAERYALGSQNSVSVEYLYNSFLRGGFGLLYREANFGSKYIMNFGLGFMYKTVALQVSYENPLLLNETSRYPYSNTFRLSLFYTWSKHKPNQSLVCPRL